METEITQMDEAPKRPAFLKVLCILSFIGSGFGILACIIMPFVAPKILETMANTPGFDSEKQADAIHALQAGPAYYAISGAIAILSLIGVLQMWKLKKMGMYLYLAAAVLGFIIPIVMEDVAISYFALFLTLAFIAMYAVNFKHLK